MRAVCTRVRRGNPRDTCKPANTNPCRANLTTACRSPALHLSPRLPLASARGSSRRRAPCACSFVPRLLHPLLRRAAPRGVAGERFLRIPHHVAVTDQWRGWRFSGAHPPRLPQARVRKESAWVPRFLPCGTAK